MRILALKWSYVLLLLVVVIFVVFRDYFSLDEPDLFWELKTGFGPGSYGSYPRFLSEGRPLYGLLVLAGFKLVATAANLKYLRVLSVLLTFCFCFLIFNYLIWEGVSEPVSFIASLLIFCLPGFSEFICWAECFPHHIPSMLSFCGGILTQRGLEKHLGREGVGRMKSTLFLLAAVILEITALFFYQTLALAFLMPAFFTLLIRQDVTLKSKRVFLSYFCFVFFLSLGLYYQFFQGLIENAGLSLASRGKLGPEIWPKICWFFLNLIEVSKFHLLLFKSTGVQYLFTALTVMLFCRDLFRKKFADLLLLLIFSILLLLPQLLIKENWMASRNYMLVGAIWVFYLVNRVFEILPKANLLAVGCTGLVFSIAMLCNMHFAWVSPESKDYTFMQRFVNKLPEIGSNDLVVEAIPPKWNLHSDKSAYLFYSDEWNYSIFITPWALQNGLKLIYSYKYPLVAVKTIESHLRIKILKNASEFSPEQNGRLIHLDLNY